MATVEQTREAFVRIDAASAADLARTADELDALVRRFQGPGVSFQDSVGSGLAASGRSPSSSSAR